MKTLLQSYFHLLSLLPVIFLKNQPCINNDIEILNRSQMYYMVLVRKNLNTYRILNIFFFILYFVLLINFPNIPDYSSY